MMSKEINDLFDYDAYIVQNSDFFKFSIDSVLLSEFVDIKNGQKKILDLCSGNAPVPMILSKKYPNLDITGIELQKDIYDMGLESIKMNNFNNIKFINDDVNNILSYFDNSSFDIITVNPPYFKIGEDNLINDNEIKAIARHELKINLDQILNVSSKMLKNQGYLYMVHRPERLADIIISCNKYNFGVKRIVSVFNNNQSKCSMILIEAVYNGKNYVKIENPLFLSDYKSYKNIFRR